MIGCFVVGCCWAHTVSIHMCMLCQLEQNRGKINSVYYTRICERMSILVVQLWWIYRWAVLYETHTPPIENVVLTIHTGNSNFKWSHQVEIHCVKDCVDVFRRGWMDLNYSIEVEKLGLANVELIQGTCRLSLKMGRGDEQKPLMHCIQMAINIDFRSSEIPPLPNNGIFKSVFWTFADPLNRLYSRWDVHSHCKASMQYNIT